MLRRLEVAAVPVMMGPHWSVGFLDVHHDFPRCAWQARLRQSHAHTVCLSVGQFANLVTVKTAP